MGGGRTWRAMAVATSLLVPVAGAAASTPEQAGAAPLPAPRSARVMVYGGVTPPAAGLVAADLFPDATGDSVVFDVRQDGTADVPNLTFRVNRPAGGWAIGTTSTTTSGPWSSECSVLRLTDVAVDGDGVPTRLIGGFDRSCGTDIVSGVFVYPADAEVGVLAFDRSQLEMRTGRQHGAQTTLGVHNVGSAPLTLGTPTLDEPAGGWSLPATTCGVSLPAGGSCSVTIADQPVGIDPVAQRLTFPTAGPGPTDAARLRLLSTPLPNGYGEIHPIPTARIFTGTVGAGAPSIVAVAGHGGIPSSGALGVIAQVTVSKPAGAGSLSMVRGDAGPTTAISLAYPARKSTSSLVLAKLAPNGTVRVALTSTASVTIDVVGWVADDSVLARGYRLAPDPSAYYGPPARAELNLDTNLRGFRPVIDQYEQVNRVLVSIDISKASADAELHVWTPDTAEPTVGAIQVEARAARTALFLATTDRYGYLAVRLTKGTANVRINTVATLELGNYNDFAARLYLLDLPATVFDTAATTPIKAGALRTAEPALPAELAQTGALFGALVTSGSGAAGKVNIVSGPIGLEQNPGVPTLDTRAGVTVSAPVLVPTMFDWSTSTTRLGVRNLSKRPTNARVDAAAVVIHAAPPGYPATAATAAPGASMDPAVLDDPGDAPPVPTSDGPQPTAVTNAMVAVSFHALPLWYVDNTVPLTTKYPATMTESPTQVTLAAADGVAVSLGISPVDHQVHAGRFLVSAAGFGACGGYGSGRMDVETVTYEAGVLTHLTGRATVDCYNGRRTYAFAFPADEPMPVLQLDHRVEDLDGAGLFSGTDRDIDVHNIGTAPLVVGQLVIRDSATPVASIVGDDCSHTSVPAGGSCTVTVHFQPLLDRAETATNWLVIPSNATADGRAAAYALTGSAGLNDLGLSHEAGGTVVLDTTVGPGSPSVIDIATAAGVPATALTGAGLELTVTGSSAAGSLTLTAHGVATGTGVSLVFAGGEQLTQAAYSAVSPDGRLDVHVTTTVHVRIRLMTYIGSDRAPETGLSHSVRTGGLAPERILDTRTGRSIAKGKLKAGVATTTGIGGNAASAYLVVTTSASTTPITLDLWWSGDQAGAVRILVSPGVSRSSTVYVPAGVAPLTLKASAAVDVSIDLSGQLGGHMPDEWEGRIFLAPRPVRDLDTRIGGPKAAISARTFHAWEYVALEDDGIGVGGLLGTLTTVSTTKAGSVAFLDGDSRYLPTGVSITSRAKVDVSNFVDVGTGARVSFYVFAAKGTTHYVFDRVGFVALGARNWFLDPQSEATFGPGSPAAETAAAYDAGSGPNPGGACTWTVDASQWPWPSPSRVASPRPCR